jgi:hypothetical protein
LVPKEPQELKEFRALTVRKEFKAYKDDKVFRDNLVLKATQEYRELSVLKAL